MKLNTIQNIRAILTSNQITVRGDQIGVVVEAVAELTQEEQKILEAQKAEANAEVEKRVTQLADERIKKAIAEVEQTPDAELPPSTQV
jgi:hypothetical protein